MKRFFKNLKTESQAMSRFSRSLLMCAASVAALAGCETMPQATELREITPTTLTNRTGCAIKLSADSNFRMLQTFSLPASARCVNGHVQGLVDFGIWNEFWMPSENMFVGNDGVYSGYLQDGTFRGAYMSFRGLHFNIFWRTSDGKLYTQYFRHSSPEATEQNMKNTLVRALMMDPGPDRAALHPHLEKHIDRWLANNFKYVEQYSKSSYPVEYSGINVNWRGSPSATSQSAPAPVTRPTATATRPSTPSTPTPRALPRNNPTDDAPVFGGSARGG